MKIKVFGMREEYQWASASMSSSWGLHCEKYIRDRKCLVLTPKDKSCHTSSGLFNFRASSLLLLHLMYQFSFGYYCNLIMRQLSQSVTIVLSSFFLPLPCSYISSRYTPLTSSQTFSLFFLRLSTHVFISLPLFSLSLLYFVLIEGWKGSFIFWQHQMMKGLWSLFTPAGGAQR